MYKYDKETVTKIMKSNKSEGTSPELKLRKVLWKRGIKGYRKNYKKAHGKPDIAFVGKKIAIFVNGCFWHGCEKCNKKMPKRNEEFWKNKIEKNKLRDKKTRKKLEAEGWRVITIWECDIKEKLDDAIKEIEEIVINNKTDE